MPTRTRIAIGLVVTTLGCGRAGLDTSAPALTATPGELVFAAQPGDIVTPKAILLEDATGGRVGWSAVSSRSWILVTPASGETPAEISVRADPTGLLPGEHRGTVTFAVPQSQTEQTAAQVVLVRLVLTAPGWEPLNGPHGGDIRSVAGDDGHVIAGDSNGGIWVSGDDGETFTFARRLGSGPIADLALDASMGLALAASESSGVWKSTDLGTSWTQTTHITGCTHVGLHATSDEIFALGVGRVLSRSSDRGVTWVNITPAGVTVVAVEASLSPPDEVLALASRQTVHRSPDGGDTWVEHNVPNATAFVHGTYRDPQTQALFVGTTGSIHRSTDGGATFETVLTVPYCTTWDLSRTAVGLFAASAAGLLASNDDGATWQSPLVDASPVRDTTRRVAASDTGVIAAHEYWGVLTGDRARVQPARGIYAHRLTAISHHPARGDLTALSGNALWRFDPTTGTWTAVRRSEIGLSSSDDLEALVADPADPDRLLVGTCNAGLLESLDGGRTWQPTGVGTGACVTALSWAPDDLDRIYAGTNHGVSLSTNRASTFQPIFDNGGNTVSPVQALAGGSVVFANASCDVRLRLANGQEYPLDAGCAVSALTRAANNDVFIGSNTGIFVLRDSRTSVEPISLGAGTEPTVLLAEGPRLWASYDRLGLVYSEDGGVSFDNAGSPAEDVTALAWDATTESLLVGTAGMGVLRYAP